MNDQSQSREWNSSVYHRLSQPQVSWGKRVLSRLKLRGDEQVLDAGCGSGRLTADLLEALPHGRVVGVDLSQNMLHSAREHLRADFGGRLTLAIADLQHLPFYQAFDGIVSTAAFHWVLDHDKLFASLRSALRPSGWLHAQCGGGENLMRLRQRVGEIARSTPYARYLGSFREPWFFADAEHAANILRRAGFMNIETSVEDARTVLDDPQQYEEFVRNIILRSHLRQLPSEELRSELMAKLTTLAGEDDPPYLLDYCRLNLSGTVA